MLILTIIGVTVLLIIEFLALMGIFSVVEAIANKIIYCFLFFDEYTNTKYSYLFFTWRSFIYVNISLWLIFLGYLWKEKAAASGGDTLNGSIVIFAGLIFALTLVLINLRRTNFFLGFVGTLFQFSLTSILVYVLPFFGLIFIQNT